VREGCDAAGRTITNATVGGNLEAFPRVAFRSLFPPTDTPLPRSSRAAFAVAAAHDADFGLMVDVGAGTGAHLAPFAARGWEVRAFEPDSVARNQLGARVPTDWELFLDPRAIDGTDGICEATTDDSVTGITLAQRSELGTVVGDVLATTPTEALEVIGAPLVDVLAVDANGWEMEVLRAWPFETHRPSWLIVGLDDRVSPRFGFEGASVVRHLRSLGYQVFAFVDDGVVEADAVVSPAGGGAVVLVATSASDRIDSGYLDALDRAARISERLVETAGPSAEGRDPSLDAESPRVAALEAELDKIRRSTSWRLGSRMVQTVARIRRGPRSLKRRFRRLLRR
jgi:FkbM family methyltransferase